MQLGELFQNVLGQVCFNAGQLFCGLKSFHILLVYPIINQVIVNNNHLSIRMKQEEKEEMQLPKTFTILNIPQPIAKRVEQIVKTLNQPFIDKKQIKKYMNEGIPDEAKEIREYCWKLILGYLPKNKTKWQQQIQQQQKTYLSFIDQYLSEQKFVGHPIVFNRNEVNRPELEKDFLLWQQIQKDTCRTQAQLSFFSTQADQIMIPFFTNTRKQKYKIINGQTQSVVKQLMSSQQKQRKTYKYDYMTRILFIFAKLHPRVEYVQGMNEILAPIFYLLNSSLPKNAPLQQAACFFMFNNAMTDIIELHIKDFDKKENGIHNRLHQINRMLLAIDPDVWEKLDQCKIDPFFYCFRWVTLLFSQEFQLFDTLRIWESIFSYDDRAVYISYFSLALILSCREFIFKAQYTQILSYLKKIGDHVNVTDVIHNANQLYYTYRNLDLTRIAKQNKKKLQDKKLQQQKGEKKSKNKILSFFKRYI